LRVHRRAQQVLAEPDRSVNGVHSNALASNTHTHTCKLMGSISYLSLWLAPAASVARNAQSPSTLLCVTAYGLRPSPAHTRGQA
jgi:hypothetical protein